MAIYIKSNDPCANIPLPPGWTPCYTPGYAAVLDDMAFMTALGQTNIASIDDEESAQLAWAWTRTTNNPTFQ